MKVKNKKCKSKSFITFAFGFMLCFFMATSLWAAKKIYFSPANANDYIRQLNEKGITGKALGLTNDEAIKWVRSREDFNGITHSRYQQFYKGIPVWGMETIISKDHADKVVNLHGDLLLDTPRDVTNIPTSLDPTGALKKMKNQHKAKDAGATWEFRNETYGTYIYFTKKNKSELCYVVSFFADNEKGNPSRPIFFIDVKSGKVIETFDVLTYGQGTGPGGNLKTGQYTYNDAGGTYPGFGVTVNGSTCTMNTTNVKTVDLNHGTSGTTAFSYTCYNNTHENINGGYCPMNDAQYFGQVVYDMYQAWYSTPVLPFQLTMRCHYSTNYENAFWDGSSMTFGDGYTTFYPLCGLDVSAHEVSHGFTENHSDLTYSGQSGGINEAFSDMAGEAAKYYMRGFNDFKVGFDIFKSPTDALRYMYDPPLDGVSIDHVSEYYSGLDVHYSSGIYNKVFYLIATSSGWTTRMAFDIFVKANTDYWTASETFASGALDVKQAALDYGYPCSAVAAAFANVGITITACPTNDPPVANFSCNPTTVLAGGTVNFTDISTNDPTSWSWSFLGGTPSTSIAKNPSVVYNTLGTYNVSLTTTNAYGSDTETKTNYITITNSIPPPTDDEIAEALDVTGMTFTKSGNAQWTNVTGGYYDDDSATSGTINHSQFCSIETTVTVSQTSNVKFYWQVSSEANYDYLRFYIDGVQKNQISGSTTWDQVSNTIAAGTHTLKWIYSKDTSISSGSDCGWVDKLEIVTVCTYCSSGSLDCTDEWIARVRIGTLDKSSGASNYSDFTSIVTNYTRGTSQSVTLTPGFSVSSYTEYWNVWIDYNKDCDFTDPGETVFSKSGSSAVTGSFTISATASTGNTRMRVSMKYGAYSTPCELHTYGEVEDYTANIL